MAAGRWETSDSYWSNKIRERVERIEQRGLSRAEALAKAVEQLCDGTRRFNKSKLPAFIPAQFVEGEPRSSEAVIDVHLAVLDYDDGSRIEDEVERWKDHAFVLHTSWSHRPEHHKFRIALPLVWPISREVWPRMFEFLRVKTCGRIDPQTKNPDRLFFLPAVPGPDAPWVATINDAPWLDIRPDELPRTPEEIETERRKRWRGPRRRQFYSSDDSYDAAKRRQYATEPDARRALAERLGARIVARSAGECAIGVVCPACGRPDAYFFINPHRATGARCNHERTCGWVGSLTTLEA